MANQTLAQAAEKAVRTGPFETDDGWCMRFVRQVVQGVYGAQYDHILYAPRTSQATAKHAALRFVRNSLGFHYNGRELLKPGDILFKTVGSGGFGHVGIYLADGRVAENSSTVLGRVRGALGFRSLREFGEPQIVARLPEPKPEPEQKPQPKPKPAYNGPPRFLLNGRELVGARLENRHIIAPVVSVLACLGYRVQSLSDRRRENGRVEVTAAMPGGKGP